MDFGLDGYDDDDEEEEEEASVTAGGRGRGDCSPPPEDAGTHSSFATLCVGSVVCRARRGPGMMRNDGQSLPGAGEGRGRALTLSTALASHPCCDPQGPSE